MSNICLCLLIWLNLLFLFRSFDWTLFCCDAKLSVICCKLYSTLWQQIEVKITNKQTNELHFKCCLGVEAEHSRVQDRANMEQICFTSGQQTCETAARLHTMKIHVNRIISHSEMLFNREEKKNRWCALSKHVNQKPCQEDMSLFAATVVGEPLGLLRQKAGSSKLNLHL